MSLKNLILTRRIISNIKSARKLSLSASNCKEAFASQSEVRINWDQSVDDAIKCVNYESPFSKLSYMTTDKNVNWIKYLEKLKLSEHPMRDAVE
jgi:hypothetical protein